MGFVTQTFYKLGPPEPERDYIKDVLHKVSTTPQGARVVYSYKNVLLFFGCIETEGSNELFMLEYRTAYINMDKFLTAHHGAELIMLLRYKKIFLTHVRNTWLNRFKVRKIYRGELPRCPE